MRFDYLKAQISGQAFAVHPKTMQGFISLINKEITVGGSVEKTANDSVEYEEKENVAIVSIEGGLYKKNMSGLCMSVASYDQIISSIDRAEANNSVDTILFRVDTPGGAVAGVDEVGERIKASPKKTITLYENMGASAGIWAFTASDEIYATETTNLGSIGVRVDYLDAEDDNKWVTLVSNDAENKDCSLKGNCKEKLQSNINAYQDIFHSRVSRNTGFTKEQIKTVFNNGDMIFASEAKEQGFIKDVTTFKTLLENNMGGNITAKTEALVSAPTASGDKVATKSKAGENMSKVMTNEDILALENSDSNFNAMKVQLITRNDKIAGLDQTVLDMQSALDNKDAELKALDEKLSEAVSKEDVDAQVATATAKSNEMVEARINQAFSNNTTDKATLLSMVATQDDAEASKISLDAKEKFDALPHGTAKKTESALLAYAQNQSGVN